jgi:integrase
MERMMTKVLLTPSTVESVKCPAGKRKLDLFDQRTKGLLLEVRETGGRTYYLRYTNARGKARQHRLADARDVTLAQARQLADQTRNRIAMGEDPAEARSALRTVPTFAQFIENDFLPHIRLHKRSWQCDVSLLNNHLLPFLSSMHMDSIGRRDIQRVISDRREQGKAAGTCDRILILSRRIFNLALKWQVPGIASNPAKEVDRLNVDNKRERYLNEPEIRRLQAVLEHSENPLLRYIIPMLLVTGARKREVLDARWEDFDFESRLWKIPVTKSGKPRYVPISDGLIAILNSVPRLAGSRYVFPNPDTGKPYVTIFYAWNTARQRAGLPDVRIHDLRHSFASILINSGRSLYEVQHLLGHTQSKTTERYAHLQRETLLKAANVVAKMVGGAIPARAAVTLTHV